MTCFIGRCVSAGALCGALLATERAHAEAPGKTLLQYQAPSECPSAADFRRSVQHRSARIQLVDAGSYERVLSITVETSGAAAVGTLRLTEADGSARERSVRSTSCSDAVEGLALIATVSLDPQALLEAPPQETAPTPEAALPPPPPPPAAGSGPSDRKRAAAPSARPRLAAPPPRSRAALETRLGAQLEAYLHAVPEAALGAQAYLDLTFRSQAHLAPLLRVALDHVERRGIREGSGAASFALTVGTLSVCPWRLATSFVELRPCAWLSGGGFRSWSSKTTNPQAHTGEYWAGGASALAFVKLGKIAEISLDVGLGAPLLRDRFVFEGSQFWKTPGLYLRTGLGLRFLLR